MPQVPAGARRQWAADRAMRAPMRSPGRPEPSRAVQREFWRLIASGVTTVQAAEGVGVSAPVGIRWFRHAGGMTPLSLDEPTGRYLSFAEREEIALLKAQDKGVREIALTIGRDPGTVSRELRRNAATRGGKPVYRAVVAQWKAQQAAKRPKPAKLVGNERLREYVQDRLAGNVRRHDGTIVPGPRTPPWKGLNKPHRRDRRWSTAWSPEQIAHRLKVDFPDDESMRISHEAIYQSLFIEGRGALKRELVTCLRTGRALREPRVRSRNKPQGHVTADVVLSERPAEANDRAVPGHWEGDLIIGTDRSAIGTLVERSSHSTLLVHLPRMEGWGEKPYVKNGPSLGGYGAVAMNAALTASMTKLPDQLRKTLTWDRGKGFRATRSSRWRPGRGCSSLTRTHHGSARRMRTQTVCCGSTSRLVLGAAVFVIGLAARNVPQDAGQADSSTSCRPQGLALFGCVDLPGARSRLDSTEA